MDQNFASRAGNKLEWAIKQYSIQVEGKIAADLGCSTGGFTSCLLQHGAIKVYAVDTGYGVLDWKLRNDPRVVVMERKNALYIDLPEKMDIITLDMSWTRLEKSLPKALTMIKNDGDIIALLKPHYEAMKMELNRGKVKPEFMEVIIGRTLDKLKELGIQIKEMTESPIVGEKGGNHEYLLWIKP